MANFYFEIKDPLVKQLGGKYLRFSRSTNPTPPLDMVSHCDRAWCEQDGVVWFIKHRYLPYRPNPKVDMKEFMWIKLRAKQFG